jgi:hypothetical protein
VQVEPPQPWGGWVAEGSTRTEGGRGLHPWAPIEASSDPLPCERTHSACSLFMAARKFSYTSSSDSDCNSW